MLMFVRTSVLVVVIVFFLVMMMLRLVLLVRVRRAFVNAEFHPLDALPLLPFEVHVKVADLELRELPFECGWLHAEIDERADGHVAGDAGEAIEEEDFHEG